MIKFEQTLTDILRSTLISDVSQSFVLLNIQTTRATDIYRNSQMFICATSHNSRVQKTEKMTTIILN